MDKYQVSTQVINMTNETFEYFTGKRNKTVNIHELVMAQSSIDAIEIFLTTYAGAIIEPFFCREYYIHTYRLNKLRKMLTTLQQFEQV